VVFHDLKLAEFEEFGLPQNEFDKLLLAAVEEGLSILGESSKQAIYFHLEQNFGIKRDEIPSKIEAFSVALERIFGFGANYLEISIIRILYKKLNRDFKWYKHGNFTFIEYATQARKSFQKRTREEIAYFRKMVIER
jgi:hypothetical protein